jgi:hypothetical protein
MKLIISYVRKNRSGAILRGNFSVQMGYRRKKVGSFKGATPPPFWKSLMEDCFEKKGGKRKRESSFKMLLNFIIDELYCQVFLHSFSKISLISF